jgi:hypothetical protein
MRAVSVLLVSVAVLFLAGVTVRAEIDSCPDCPHFTQLDSDAAYPAGAREGPIPLTGADALAVTGLKQCTGSAAGPTSCDAHFEVQLETLSAGATITWRRQVKGAGAFVPITDSVGPSNTALELVVPVTYANNNMDVYQAEACFPGTAKCTLSNPATLNFKNTPVLGHVADQNPFEGGTATFHVDAPKYPAAGAVGTEQMSFQWFEVKAGGDEAVLGGDSDTLVINGVTAADEGKKFYVHVGDNNLEPENYVDSNQATLTIRTRNGPLHIDVHPTDVTIQAPADCDATFTVEASGGVEPLFYQWQVRRCDQEDGDGKFDDAYQYQPNRDTDGDGHESEVEGDSSERDGDRHGDFDRHDRDGDRDGWEGRVCGPNDGFINIDGATLATYKFGTSASDHKRYYRVVVHDSATPVADHVISHEVYLNVQFAPVFLKQVKNQSVREGRATTFPFKSESNPVASVRWQVNVKGEKDANDELVFTDVHNGYFASRYFHVHAEDATTLDGNYYRVVLTNALGTAVSDAGKLTVIPKSTVTHSVDWEDEDDDKHHHRKEDKRERDSSEDSHEYGRGHEYDSHHRNRLASLQAKIQKAL